MGRLTERTADGILVKEDHGEDVLKTLYQCYGAEPMLHYANCDEGYCSMEKLAEYEDLEEQGKLLKLPCAIGDIVYWLCGTEILQMDIEYFLILPNKIKFSFKYCGGGERLKNFSKYMCDSDIGKNVFSTREEAEAALKEL